ncbi:MAG: hypothetical protein ACOCTK_02060 [Candidatus Saliniplasma sp.]
MNIPVVGFELFSILGLLFLLGFLMVLAYFIDPVRQLPGINAVPKQTALIVGLLLVIGSMAMGGVLTAPTAEEIKEYYTTTELDIYAYDEVDGSSADTDIDVKFFEPGYNDWEYASEDVSPLATVDMDSDGTGTLAGWDTERFPTAVAMFIDSASSNYYPELKEVDMRVDKDNEENSKTLTMRGTQHASITKSEDTPTWADGENTVYINIDNEDTDKELWNMAVKFTTTNESDEVSLEDVGSGGSIETVDDEEYIVLDNDKIEEDGRASVAITVDIEDESDFDFTLTYDDLFGQFLEDPDDAWADDDDIDSATQTSTSIDDST